MVLHAGVSADVIPSSDARCPRGMACAGTALPANAADSRPRLAGLLRQVRPSRGDADAGARGPPRGRRRVDLRRTRPLVAPGGAPRTGAPARRAVRGDARVRALLGLPIEA